MLDERGLPRKAGLWWRAPQTGVGLGAMGPLRGPVVDVVAGVAYAEGRRVRDVAIPDISEALGGAMVAGAYG